MPKKTFTGKTIGLFLKPENKDEFDLISKALKEEGANIITFKSESELAKSVMDSNPSLTHSVIFDADITGMDLAAWMDNVFIVPISISFHPNVPVKVEGEWDILILFLNNLLLKIN